MKLILTSLSVVILSASLGFSQDMPCMERHREMMGPMEERLIMEDLTPEQRTQIEDIKTETRKVIIPLRSQIELKEIDLHKEMKLDKPNHDKVLKIAQEIHELEWQIKKAEIEERLKIASILTPQQREKMRMMHRHRMIKKIEIEREKKE